jgi:hypothetical protein
MSSWTRVGTPRELADAWRAMFGADFPVRPPVVHRNGRLEALVGREPVGPHQQALEDLRWHISVRAPGRVPTWPELVDAAHSLRPGVVFCVPMPPRTWWLNVHEHVLHLWETRDPNLERQWRSESGGHEPS